MASSEGLGLPSELLTTPLPLIGFTGLEPQANPVQKTIWDSFHSNRKNDRAAIQFKLLPGSYEFPVSKPKRQSYEWYHPKGILKRNWMLKHLHVLPAIVVLFQEMEWNDPQWTEKQMQCASLIQHLKNALQGRNTRICLVLLQKAPQTPATGEELLASERLASITKACDLNAKLIFVLSYNEHLMGHVIRLESAFLDIAQGYYSMMVKQVKSHRDQISEYPSLKIRHHFKLGFISEMRNDLSAAQKYYTQAYVALNEIAVSNANCLEIKTIAGYSNFKICRLMFKLNVPRDSITQFKGHIEKYKATVGLKELAFEHYAWLSVQYSAFAELFCEAIKGGLKAIQTQHPGIYYQKAAEYIAQRKDAFQESLSLDGGEPKTPTSATQPVAANALYSEFYGVRNRTGETMTEQQLIACIQDVERTINHSAAIIGLLGQAMAQFKAYKCLRFRKKLAIGMAEEYLKSGDHAKALTLYSLMLTDYRSDKWNSIFTRVLQKTLRSAFLSAAIQDFIQCSIEAMSPKILIEQSERIVILENLWKVFQSVAPVSSSQITPELKQNWDAALVGLKQPIIIDLDKISDLIDVRVTFATAEIKFEDAVELTLFVHSLMDVPLKLKSLSLIIADSKTHCKLKAGSYRRLEAYKEGNWVASGGFVEYVPNGEFMLEPQAYYELKFKAESKQFMENEELQVAKLEIKMGTDKCFVILTKGSSLAQTRMFRSSPRNDDLLDHVAVKGHCYIKPTFHLTTTIDQNNQPMLVNEHFKIVVTLRNNFPIKLSNIGMRIHVGNAQQRNKVHLATKLGHPTQKYSSFIQLNVSDLDPNSTGHVVYYVMSLVEGNIELSQKVWYETDLGSREASEDVKDLHSPILSLVSDVSPVHLGPAAKLPAVGPSERLKKQISNHNIKIDFLDEIQALKKTKIDTIILPCVNELKFTARLYTLSRQALMRAYRNEDFLMRVNIEVMAPFEIEILDRFFVSDHNIRERPYSNKSILNRHVTAKKGYQIEDVRVLNSESLTSEWLDYESFKNPKDELVIKLTDRKAPKSNPMGVLLGNALPVGEPIRKSNSLEDFNKPGEKPVEAEGAHQEAVQKTFYNKTMDALHVSERCRGFFKNHPAKIGENSPAVFPLFGVYCVRWRRPGCAEENESKFLINGIEIVEPLLNIYCYIEEHLYVNEPLVYQVTLTNPGTKILHLTATLNNSNSFMFAGHKQLNISVFAYSSVELKYNLYPWKTGWQALPELQLEFNREYCLPEDEQLQSDLNHLVKRWMPRTVFIHPPTKTLSI